MVEFKTEIPDYVAEGISIFVETTQEAVGASLVAIVLYGGLAKGHYDPSGSDVNILVVLEPAGVAQMRALAPSVVAGQETFGLSVQILTRRDFERSTDVFPIMFLDIQQHHQLLAGEDVLSDLEIEREHLRLRCEQGLKNLLIQLRKLYVEQEREAAAIEMTLLFMTPSFLLMLNAVLMLEGHPGCTSREELVSVAGERDPTLGETLSQLLAIKRGELELELESLDALYQNFMFAVEAVAEHIDALEDG